MSGTGPSILGLSTCHSWITERFCSFGKLSRSGGTPAAVPRILSRVPSGCCLPLSCACYYSPALCIPITARKTSLLPLQGRSSATQTPWLFPSRRTFKKQLINLITSFLCHPEQRGMQKKYLAPGGQSCGYVDTQAASLGTATYSILGTGCSMSLTQEEKWGHPACLSPFPLLSHLPHLFPSITSRSFSQSSPSNFLSQRSCIKDLERKARECREVQPL